MFEALGNGVAAGTPRALSPADRRRHADRRRSLRVWLLVFAIAAMSLADLSMTMTYLRSVGMGEANPLARYVMSLQSPGLLAAWKCVSVAAACVIFVWARKRWTTEAACWGCVFVLTALCIRWIHYSHEATALTPNLQTVLESDTSGWVTLDDR